MSVKMNEKIYLLNAWFCIVVDSAFCWLLSWLQDLPNIKPAIKANKAVVNIEKA
jgi:hypothetical protein